jgi:hypothetical protein
MMYWTVLSGVVIIDLPVSYLTLVSLVQLTGAGPPLRRQRSLCLPRDTRDSVVLALSVTPAGDFLYWVALYSLRLVLSIFIGGGYDLLPFKSFYGPSY